MKVWVYTGVLALYGMMVLHDKTVWVSNGMMELGDGRRRLALVLALV